MRLTLLLCLAAASCVHAPPAPAPELPAPPAQALFNGRVRPVLETRCVVCHACYNSPCQLNQQTFEGVERGGTKALIYENRLVATRPTRMFQDATSTKDWRAQFGFFPVISHSGKPTDSLLYHFITHRRADARGGTFDVDQKTTCPDTVAATTTFLQEHPEAGMPWGMPPLADAEYQALVDWLAAGAPPPLPPPPSEPAVTAATQRWEAFLNEDDVRTQLVARFLYEHLFLAHLHFGPDSRDFFRLVRSSTPPGQPVEELVTVRPFDDPGPGRVFYRLVRLTETIVHKTHAPYELSDARLERLRELFFSTPWTLDALPGYQPEVAGNPFVAFAAIPARARYQFMLDSAYYLVRTFIHGPVCKGPMALNVIDEHFWVLFLAPHADPSVTDPEFLKAVAPHLRVPSEGGDSLEAVYDRFKAAQINYLRQRSERARRAHAPGHVLEDLWDGDGHHRDALLTVYRHFDSASVVRGAVGGMPKTSWVLDFPIFERVYYDLVAGFNVYGNLVHTSSTRRYMDDLRVEGENTFLEFLPLAERPKLRATWYRGPGVEAYIRLVNPWLDTGVETRVRFEDPANAKEELWHRVRQHHLPAPVVGPDRAPPAPLRALADRTGAFVAPFPEVTLVRVGDQVVSLIRNRAHLNVASIMMENVFLAPEEDTLGIVQGTVGSYPNLFLVVPPEELETFAAQLGALKAGDDSWPTFLGRWGVSRTSQDFWAQADWFQAQALREDPIEGGLLDLSRYLSAPK